MPHNPFRSAALAAAARGWPVFPLVPDGKTPTIKNWERAATTDYAQIRRWWPGNSRKNIGIACGPSGLVVVDLDKPRDGTARPAEWERPGITDGADVLAAVAERHGTGVPLGTYSVQTATVIHGQYSDQQAPQRRDAVGMHEPVVAGISAASQRRAAVAASGMRLELGGVR